MIRPGPQQKIGPVVIFAAKAQLNFIHNSTYFLSPPHHTLHPHSFNGRFSATPATPMFVQIQPAARIQLAPPPFPPSSSLRRRRPHLQRRCSRSSFSRLRILNCSTVANDGGISSPSEICGENGGGEDEVRRAYPFHEIEPKWQRYWEEEKTFRTPDEIDTSKPKFYVLDMFPYPRSLSLSSS